MKGDMTGLCHFPDPYLYQQLGLIKLRDFRRRSACANACKPCPRDEREAETKHGQASEAPADKRAGNR